MPGNYGEYTRPSVTANGCSYSTLSSYNQNYFGRGYIGAPNPAQTTSHQIMVVPSYGAPGYRSLTVQKIPSCSGYYSVNNAYPSYPNACGVFSSNLCG